MDMEEVEIEKPDDMNFILGQSHFIKSVEDLYEALANVPGARFGLAFCEASGDRLIRVDGNDDGLKKLAVDNARRIGAGHSFIIFLENCFPISVLNAVKAVPEVCRIFCATANPTRVLVAECDNAGETGRGILGVIDGYTPLGIEDDDDVEERKAFLRNIGYKR
ncbi:MAG: adenosine-specific kinase [Thermoplasmatota archaeon]